MSTENTETITIASRLERAPNRNLGGRLRNAREAKGLAIEEVARKLFLNAEVVQKIETDNYQDMPAITFMRGYLRSYANLVGLDSEAIIKDFNAMGLQDAPAPMSTQRIYHRDSTLFGRSFTWIGLSLAIVVVLFVVVWIHSEFSNSALNEASATGGATLTTNNASTMTTTTATTTQPLTTANDNTTAATTPAVTTSASGSSAAATPAVTTSASGSSLASNAVTNPIVNIGPVIPAGTSSKVKSTTTDAANQAATTTTDSASTSQSDSANPAAANTSEKAKSKQKKIATPF